MTRFYSAYAAWRSSSVTADVNAGVQEECNFCGGELEEVVQCLNGPAHIDDAKAKLLGIGDEAQGLLDQDVEYSTISSSRCELK
jgi:hypothetical protein